MDDKPKKRSAVFWVIVATLIAAVISAAGVAAAILYSSFQTGPAVLGQNGRSSAPLQSFGAA